MTEKPEEKTAATVVTPEQLMAIIKAQQEEMKDVRGELRTLAEAIVGLNKKIETKGSSPNEDQAGGILTALRDIAGGGKGGSLEDLAKQAESLAKAADALDRFRNPSKIGIGEALLMRAGIRAIYPRYMTKTEIEKAEKMLGTWEALEETEETEHVT